MKLKRRLRMGAQGPFKFNKRVLITGAISIVIGFGIFLHACNNMEATKEREIMIVTMMNSMPNVSMPLIDRSAALKTETATFGLG
jgi:hypothetical protein